MATAAERMRRHRDRRRRSIVALVPVEIGASTMEIIEDIGLIEDFGNLADAVSAVVTVTMAEYAREIESADVDRVAP